MRSASGLNAGRQLTDHDLERAIPLLGLFVDTPWSSWVHRRSETVSLLSRRAARHEVAIDLTVPSVTAPAAAASGQLCVPLTLASKNEFSRVVACDESNRTVPIFTRRESAAIGAAMLVVLAHLVRGRNIPRRVAEQELPPPLLVDLRVLTNESTSVAEQRWSTLGASTKPSETDREWREALIVNDEFMGLAFDLTQGHLLLVTMSGAAGEHRSVRITFEHEGPFEREPQIAMARRAASAVAALFRGESLGPEVGHLKLTKELVVPPGHQDRVTLPTVAGFTIEDPTGESIGETLEMRGEIRATHTLFNRRVGVYKVMEQTPRNCMSLEPNPRMIEVRAGQTVEVTFRNLVLPGREPAASRHSTARIERQTRRRRLIRAFWLRSKPLGFETTAPKECESCHVTVIPPAGLQATRLKVVDLHSRGAEPVAGRGDKAYVHIPPGHGLDEIGVVVSLRPWLWTVARPAMFVAGLTGLLLLLIGFQAPHIESHGTPAAVVTLLVLVPGGLSGLIVARSEDLASLDLLYGLKAVATFPGIFAAAAASLVAVFGPDDAQLAVLGLAGATIVVFVLLCFTTYWSWRPPEKRGAGKRLARVADWLDTRHPLRSSGNVTEDGA